MKCPKDADEYDESNPCPNNRGGGYVCTRKRRHKGKHHAHQIHTGECLAVWE